MNIESVRRRFKDRLFHTLELKGEPLSVKNPVQDSDRKSKAFRMSNPNFKNRIKETLRHIPLIGFVIIWLWRMLNLPQWFYRLSRHFEGVVEQVNTTIQTQKDHETALRDIQNTLQTLKEHDSAIQSINNVLKSISDQLQQLDTFIKTQKDHETALRDIQNTLQTLKEHDSAIQSINNVLKSISDQLQQIDTFIKTQKDHETALRDIQNILETLTKTINIEGPLVIDAPPFLSVDKKSTTNNSTEFYLTFENVFRGTEAEIKERQRFYLPYVIDAFNYIEGIKCFLDAGCGRGEFIKILKEVKIPVKGVTINEAEYNDLKNQGIDVELIDVNTFLEGIEDDALAGISSFQMIEHISADYLKKFIDLSYRKITLNGVFIVESINPKCSYAINNFFYLDPTHTKPYPPELLQFLLEWHKFKDIKIIYSSACPEAFRSKTIPEHNYSDYAVIGWKR